MKYPSPNDSSREAVTAEQARKAYIEVAQAACLIDDAASRLRGVSPDAVIADPLTAALNIAGLSLAASDLVDVVNELINPPEIRVTDLRATA